MTDLKPETYYEQPERRPLAGLAAQFDGSSNSAIDISLWLETLGITAYVAPTTIVNRTSLLIPAAQSLREDGLVFPTDYVLVDADNNVWVIRETRMDRHFRKSGDTRPPYWDEKS